LIQPHLYATTGFTLFGRIVFLKVEILFHFEEEINIDYQPHLYPVE